VEKYSIHVLIILNHFSCILCIYFFCLKVFIFFAFSSGLAELLVKDAISCIFLNPFIWVYTVYKVQRELYMFLIQQFDNDPRLLKSLCQLPRVIDIIRQFYWDNSKSRFAIGSKPLRHPITKVIIGERPNREETHKIRLLLLSLGEMSLRYRFHYCSYFETNLFWFIGFSSGVLFYKFLYKILGYAGNALALQT